MTSATSAIARHQFKHPASAVFAAWLEAEAIGGWMFNPDREEVVSMRLDPVVGGDFSFAIRRAGQLLHHIGTYLDIEPDRKLVFTWGVAEDVGATSTVEVLIEPSSDGCVVTVTHRLDEAYADGLERYAEAWQRMLGRQEIYLGK